jgi:hypothetical protein
VTARRLPAALLLVLLASCAGLPPITPGGNADRTGTGGAFEPGRVFPGGRWQVLHAIRAEVPGGGTLVMMGLTLISARDRTQRSVLMTLEGFVVFDGEYDGRLTVHRALPPFDSLHFADGLMEDIRLVFFEPDGPVIDSGTLPDGGAVRRHRLPDGGTADVELLPGGEWRIRRYDPSGQLTRTARARRGKGDQQGFPETVELTAAGGQDYRLTMTLLEAVPAQAVENRRLEP